MRLIKIHELDRSQKNRMSATAGFLINPYGNTLNILQFFLSYKQFKEQKNKNHAALMKL